MKKLTWFYFIVLLLPLASNGQTIKILFDATKAETAGNADWVIDADTHNLGFSGGSANVGGGNESNPQQFPTPLQSNVTTSTAETYWEGSLSSWGIDLVKLGYEVETLPYNGRITYGDNSNAQDLSIYKVFIIDEPNILFTTAEKTALLNFVRNGGGLFMISDHVNSDRNNDGHDSPSIWNDFMTSSNNVFGITWALNDFSQTSTNFANLPNDTLLHGPYGAPVKLQYSDGSSLKINPALNPSVVGVIYVNGCSTAGDTGVMMCHARYGNGKVVATGDSSPMDDGTGDPNDVLYNGWTGDASGNHQKLIMNATIWLAETSAPVASDSFDLVGTEDTTICAGSSVTVNARGATSYLWQPGNFTTASITVSPSVSTTYIVTGTTGNVVNKDTVIINVDQFPNTTLQITPSSSTTICQGSSITLSAPAGYTYAWNNGSILQNISVSQAQSYFFTATNSNHCRAKSDTVQVVIDPFSQTTPTVSASGPLTFCYGSIVTLTAPIQTSYHWSNNSTQRSITVNQAGSFYAIVTDANNCSVNTDTVTVTVDVFSQTQQQISANGPLSFCQGGNVSLSAAAGYTYHWNNSSTQQTITVTQSGNYFLTVSDANNCTAKSDTLAVNATAGNFSGIQVSPSSNQVICAGANIILSAPSGYTYLWNTGSTQQNITVTQQGQYYFTVTAGSNCHGISDTATVNVDNYPNTTPQLTSSGPLSFCQGDSVMLATTGTGYHWSTGSTQASITISQTGIYHATVTDVNNCTALSQSITVVVHQLPQVNFQLSIDSFCTNTGAVSLQGMPAGGVFSGTGVNGTQFEPAVTGAGNFLITYNYTDSNGCSNNTATTATVYTCTNISELFPDQILVYPNPSPDVFIFENMSNSELEAIRIFDARGRMVIDMENAATAKSIRISMKDFSSGIYTAVLSQNKKGIIKKLVKID